MKNEAHRAHCMRIFEEYQRSLLTSVSIDLSSLKKQEIIDPPQYLKSVYVLRLNPEKPFPKEISAIPNRLDKMHILYIGGHSGASGNYRFNKLLLGSYRAHEYYNRHGYAENDKQHIHSVANQLTTSLLDQGFNIQDCIVDIIEVSNELDEFELLVGYQEKFHQLPPWNSIRKADHGYKANQSKRAEAPSYASD